MPCVACREVVVGAVCATVHATDDYLRWASSYCARTPATANGDLARPPDPAQPQALAQPKPAQCALGTAFILILDIAPYTETPGLVPSRYLLFGIQRTLMHHHQLDWL